MMMTSGSNIIWPALYNSKTTELPSCHVDIVARAYHLTLWSCDYVFDDKKAPARKPAPMKCVYCSISSSGMPAREVSKEATAASAAVLATTRQSTDSIVAAAGSRATAV